MGNSHQFFESEIRMAETANFSQWLLNGRLLEPHVSIESDFRNFPENPIFLLQWKTENWTEGHHKSNEKGWQFSVACDAVRPQNDECSKLILFAFLLHGTNLNKWLFER